MERYEELDMEIIRFDEEDVITTSPILGPVLPVSLNEDTLFSSIRDGEDN